MEWIRVRGARTHNLRALDVDIPQHALVAFSGVSGSGKSSLAFDTIFAEGRRRYVESLSSYARQLIGQLAPADVESIEGLAPAIAIDQQAQGRHPRSTVGTVSEVYDQLRVLFAHVGQMHCPHCDTPLRRWSVQQMIDAVLAMPADRRIALLAPLAPCTAAELPALLDGIRRRGYVRIRLDGEIAELDDLSLPTTDGLHRLDVVVDRLILRRDEHQQPLVDRIRLSDSIETALTISNGTLVILEPGAAETVLSRHYYCAVHGPQWAEELTARHFSFNHPSGACSTCGGLGSRPAIDADLVLTDRRLSLRGGAIAPWRDVVWSDAAVAWVGALTAALGVRSEQALRDYDQAALEALLYGRAAGLPAVPPDVARTLLLVAGPFIGIVPALRQALEQPSLAADLAICTSQQACPTCAGERLQPALRAVRVLDSSLGALAAQRVDQLAQWVSAARRSAHMAPRDQLIAEPILLQLERRLGLLAELGLEYLTVDRSMTTLSGGEHQRLRLATQLGGGLSGVLYVLDEPSSGLHPADRTRLQTVLRRLRDIGNSVLVVEHDPDVLREADWIVDIGPAAGLRGGELIYSGPPAGLVDVPRSQTAPYLRDGWPHALPAARPCADAPTLRLLGCRLHNLANLTVTIPLQRFVTVTGVSGSGKSSLIMETLVPLLAQRLHRSRQPAGPCDDLQGSELLERVVAIDQSPLGRSSRSNPATATKVFDAVRQLFASTAEARVRGYDAARFSFNVKGGRCESCDGEGVVQVDMQFMPDMYVPCDQCRGTRYNRETLDIHYRGASIADVLAMTIADAAVFFQAIPAIAERLNVLIDVGLDYLTLGQSAQTLSGGESQRVKLAAELARRGGGRSLYVFDEPTNGLHPADTVRLLQILQRLVDAGHSVVVIEHDPAVMAASDWLLDIGPAAGPNGGQLVAAGPPRTIGDNPLSVTGRYLREWFRRADVLS